MRLNLRPNGCMALLWAATVVTVAVGALFSILVAVFG